MIDPKGEPWFGPHRIGYGWGPRTWQGYAVTAAGLVAFILVIEVLRRL